MSTSGYNGGSSSTNNSPVNSIVGLRNNPVSTNRSPGINNMLYGMHQFETANELQFYMERVGGQGSIVNITDAAHIPIARNAVQNGGEIVPFRRGNSFGVSALPNGWLPETSGSLSGGSGNRSGSGLSSVPPGYERNTYAFVCGIHNRASANSSMAAISDSTFPAGGPSSGQRNNAIFIGYCAICQGIMFENVRGMNLLR